MPERIQRRRTKGWRKPRGCVCVTRPSAYGNPFRVGHDSEFGFVTTAQDAVDKFEAWMRFNDGQDLDLEPLRGQDLACWCALDAPCHADVLLRMANP